MSVMWEEEAGCSRRVLVWNERIFPEISVIFLEREREREIDPNWILIHYFLYADSRVVRIFKYFPDRAVLGKNEGHVGLNVRGPVNNHRTLLFRILSHTQLYRTERTLELTVPSRFMIFSLYFALIYKDRSISSALFDVLVVIFHHSWAEFVLVICARLGSFPSSTFVLRFCILS